LCIDTQLYEQLLVRNVLGRKATKLLKRISDFRPTHPRTRRAIARCVFPAYVDLLRTQFDLTESLTLPNGVKLGPNADAARAVRSLCGIDLDEEYNNSDLTLPWQLRSDAHSPCDWAPCRHYHELRVVNVRLEYYTQKYELHTVFFVDQYKYDGTLEPSH
jgi:hypothetical protein